MTNEQFAKFVKKRRTELRLSRAKFCAKYGCTLPTLFRWEHGISKPRVDAIDYWVRKIGE